MSTEAIATSVEAKKADEIDGSSVGEAAGTSVGAFVGRVARPTVGSGPSVGALVGVAVPIVLGSYVKTIVSIDPVSNETEVPISSRSLLKTVTPVLPGPSPSPLESPIFRV